MKLIKTSQLSLLLGAALVLLAIWAGAAPLLGSGSGTLGGIDERWYLDVGKLGGFIGCWKDNMLCRDHCVGTQWSYCWAGYRDPDNRMNCTGGSILTAIPQAAGGGEAYAIGYVGCDGTGNCTNMQHAACYY